MLERGHLTIDNEYDDSKTKKIGSQNLHSANLIFFTEQIYALGLIAEADKKEKSR